jgi:histidyl-tRNA synthetase
MDTWLWENRQQYQIFVGLVQLLLNREFSPLTTEPASNAAFRTDHTEAMIALLKSFSPEQITWPLKIFSMGPLFRPGRVWTDAVDVEWLGPVGAHEERVTLDLIGDMMEWLGPYGISGGDLTMVYGHVGWLRQLADQWELSPGQWKSLQEALRQGRLTALGDILAQAPRAVVRLFRPQSTEAFFGFLSAYLDVSALNSPSAAWHTRWDLSLVGRRSYYSGLVFSLYHRHAGQPLVTGGQFALPEGGPLSQGIGFTLDLDACRSAVARGERVV